MLKNVNKLQNVEACLHFLASKWPLTQVDINYESNRAAYILRITIGFLEQKMSEIDQSKS